MRLILLLLSIATPAWCYPPHPAVVAVRHQEETLPPHLRSHALHNPHLQEILPLTSLLHKGEKLVFQREADNVPRLEIYKILTHAGLLSRKPKYHPIAGRLQNRPIPYQNVDHHFFEPPHFAHPELLQHL
ncbi:uncharacterized protein LOC114360723 [Ostrinia furnacalis]|uniref:uncharacterized protein LOC114360723 n=1 Tax=Ostrinia furnacalis TaxID=93504 RepID=UPI0010390C2C|nr:uncharacterized protein LOC114360723 [Ostrinia furnacalis]